MRLSGYLYLLFLLPAFSPSTTMGQEADTLPQLYPSSITAYDLEDGMPISCAREGWMDRKGRLWVNPCSIQPEHRTVNFYQFNGRRSELINWNGAPPGAAGQIAIAGVAESGELYGYFRGSDHFFYFDPDTHRKRFFQLGQPDVAIYFMKYSPAHGLILLAASTERQLVYRMENEMVELLLDYQPEQACDQGRDYYITQPDYQVIADENLWFFAVPEFYCTGSVPGEQFRLLRFSLRDRSLRVYNYDEVFSEATPPTEMLANSSLLASGPGEALLLLFGDRLYQMDPEDGKARLLRIFTIQPGNMRTLFYTRHRFKKDEAGNLLFLMPDPLNSFFSVLMDTEGRFYDYTKVLERAATASRYPNHPPNQVWSPDFRRRITVFHAGGLIAVDLQFNKAISYYLEQYATRTISEWRAGEYIVRLEAPPDFWKVEPFSTPATEHYLDVSQNTLGVVVPTETNLEKTAEGYWWFCHQTGLIRIDSSKMIKYFRFGSSLRVNFGRFTFLDAQTVAMVLNDKQLHFYHLPTGHIDTWRDGSGPLKIKGIINELFLSKDSTLWIASLQGLWRIGLRDGRSRRIGRGEGFLDERMMCIHEDEKGRLWVGTYGSGLHIYDPEKGSVQVIGQEEGLSNNTVVGILVDDEGLRWVSTYKGINLVSGQGEVLAQLYEEDGLSTNEFNRYSYLKGSQGHLLFGSIRGVNVIEPEALKKQLRNTGDLHIYLTGLTRYDTQKGGDSTQYYGFSQQGTIELPAAHRYLDLNFALSDLIRMEDQSFSYKIERPDQSQPAEWVYLGNQSHLYLPDLSPGRYNILIRGSDYRGNWTTDPLLIPVRANRFFYQQSWFYMLVFLFFAGAVLAWMLRQRMLRKQLEAELAERTAEIMAARDQLIVQEKLASLGQLAAGIAHEIKNPLNFVHNFSEGSLELLEALQEDLQRYRSAPDEATYCNLLACLDDLRQNSLDINKHGNRADRIVKSMMDHARATPGNLRPVDLNSLVEVNINLAYHGFRALTPSFQLHIQKKLDPSLSQVNVYPQDLGRVMLNLLNNACYAVHQKQEKISNGFSPTIWVHTRNEDKEAIIRIRDNGPGIPEAIREKIFMPFFTTKAAGEGSTGLGLSISYDIIVLRHQGKLEVESEEGAFTEFVIRLPKE